MNKNESINEKLQQIAVRLKEILGDKDIKVSVDNVNRKISFLDFSFDIPNPNEKEKYILIWGEIFEAFEKEKKRIEKLRQMEILKKQMKEEAEAKKAGSEDDIQERVDLTYTQNLSYIQSIIEKNSGFEKPEFKVEEEKTPERTPGFKYGVKISENDIMNGADWYDLEEGNTEFVILTLLNNGKLDKKFKSYLKKCREHNLRLGAFFVGTSINLGEAKKELEEILASLETYGINGPIVYEINNGAVNELEKGIENMTMLTRKTLTAIVDACKFIIEGLQSKGYQAILNVDLNTISTLVSAEVLSTNDIPLVYNVLPSQVSQIDDSCQIIEFNPKNDYEKMKLSSEYFKEFTLN